MTQKSKKALQEPNADLGEVPEAAIQLFNGKKIEPGKIKEFCKEKGLDFPGFMDSKVPKHIDFKDELLRQLSGKLIKRGLEEHY